MFATTKVFLRSHAIRASLCNSKLIGLQRPSFHTAVPLMRDAVIPAQVVDAAQKLKDFEAQHTFWNNKLFKAAEAGVLTKEDFKFLWEQYYGYSKNFTRYIAGVMYNSEDDFYRAALTQNLWEESGEKDASQRHAEIFRKFLRESFGTDPKKIEFLPATKKFFQTFIEKAGRENATYGASMLSLGTEAIVARMYTIFRDAMLNAGFPKDDLLFFSIHIGCDDDHAATLEEMMYSTHKQPGWFETCKRAADESLQLRAEFFDWVYETTVAKRLDSAAKAKIAAQPVNVRSDRATMC